jgi:hypothetical protein
MASPVLINPLSHLKPVYCQSSAAQKLLNITSESLKKTGFDAAPWIDYIHSVVIPYCLTETRAQATKASTSYEANFLTMTASSGHQRLLNLIDGLKKIKYSAKEWKRADEIIVKCLDEATTAFAAFPMILNGNFTEFGQVLCHLESLFAEHLSTMPNHNPTGHYFFTIHNRGDGLIFIKDNGAWRYAGAMENGAGSLNAYCIKATKGQLPFHAYALDQTAPIKAPFLSLSLKTDAKENPAIFEAIRDVRALKETELCTLSYSIEVTYCNGDFCDPTVGNAVCFEGEFGFKKQNLLLPIPSDPLSEKLREYALLGVESIREAWIEHLNTHKVSDFVFTKIYVLPTTTEEINQKLLAALELAIEAPEENEQLIHWISDHCELEYTEEELDVAGAEHKSEDATEIVLSTKTIARAMIHKLKNKTPKHQQPKPRPEIKASAAASSYKAPAMSKEETKAKLSKSKMPESLKQQSLELLDGVRLKNKREEDKFFMDILTFQAKKSGSSMRIGSSNGSHHSARLIKQTNQSGKITYRAVTLVNKHGVDASRGHSLAVQQTNLMKLFTPLG